MKIRFQIGQTLVELMLAMGLSVLFIPALVTGIISTRQGKPQQEARVQAVTLLKEAQEAVRVVREIGWSSVSTNGTFHPSVSGSTWSLAPGSETISGFTRSVVISDVRRDVAGNIVTSGGTIDPSTKKVDVNISWNLPYPSSTTSTFYIARFLNNATYAQTTSSEFNTGNLTEVSVQSVSGGEVVLAPKGWGNWCTPNLSIQAQDLPKNGAANGVMAQEGIVYAATGDNSSGISFARVDISNTNPPVPSLAYTFDGYKTNGIFGIGNYAYLATDNNSEEIVIIDLNQVVSGKYQKVGSFNAAGITNADKVFVKGTVGYMTQDNIFRTFDLTSNVGVRSQLGSRTLAGQGTKIVVIGNYAYVSIAGATQELQILDVSNPANPIIVGQADVNGEAAFDVSVSPDGNRAYLATAASSSLQEFFIIDTSTKTGNRPNIGVYEANGMDPNGVSIATNNKAILVGDGGEEYQVINLANEALPSRCGGLQLNSGIRGISTIQEADTDAYGYIITGEISTELRIIQGGPGGQYALSGTYESAPFAYPNLTSPQQLTLNGLYANIVRPANTDIMLQVATSDPVSGSCNGAVYDYVGPDGTSSTYFTSSNGTTISATLPYSTLGGLRNPAYCLRYKAYLSTTDSYATPLMSDFTLNYSL